MKKSKIENYLSKEAGETVTMKPISIPQRLPVYMHNRWRCYKVQFKGETLVLAFAIKAATARYTPKEVQEQLVVLSKIFKSKVVFVTDSLLPHDRDRLVVLNQSYMVPGKRYFIFAESPAEKKMSGRFTPRSGKLSVTATLILLGHLHHKFADTISISDTSEQLSVSRPSVQNAFREMETLSLGERRRKAGTRKLEFAFIKHGRELWEACKDHIANPVHWIRGVNEIPEDAVVAGPHAILGFEAPADLPVEMGVRIRTFAKSGQRTMALSHAKHRLQMWIYKPTIYGGDRIDALSLWLSLRDNASEAAMAAVDKQVDDFAW